MNIRRPAAIAASTAVLGATALLAAAPAGAVTPTGASSALPAAVAAEADWQVQPAGDVSVAGDWEYVNWYWWLATCVEHGERGDGPAWQDYFCMPIGVPGQPTTYYELWVEYY